MEASTIRSRRQLRPFDVRAARDSGQLAAIGADSATVGAAVRFALPPPRHLLMEQTVAEATVRALMKDEMRCPECFILHVSDASLLGHNLWIVQDRLFHEKFVTDERAWFWTAGKNDLEKSSVGEYHSRRAATAAASIPGTSLVLNSTGGSANYHHWLMDCIPLLHGMLGHDGPIDNFVVQRHLPDSFLAIAELYGLDRRKLREFDAQSDGVLHLEHAVLPSPLNILNEWVRPELVEFLRGIVPRAAADSKTEAGPRLYLSRLDAHHGARTLLNEPELADVLTELGFRTVRMSEHSFLEQVAMIAAADVIVGLHGAAMANIVFAREDARVLLIEHELKGYSFYRHICCLTGASYSTVVGDTFYNPGHALAAQNQDWIVDVNKVTRVARALM